MNFKNTIKAGALSLALMVAGCGDFLDVNPDDMLLEEDSYSNVNELYSNFLGLTTTLGEAAEQSIVVSELLGDLMEPTPNCPQKYWEIWRYQTKNNEAANPAPFYNVVIQVNDFLRHALEFHETHPNAINEAYFKGMISTALANYSWAYLNIGKFYGEAVYYDLALCSEIDLSKAPVLKLDDLVDRLIDLMLTGVKGYTGFNALDWTKILNNTDYSWNRMAINPDALMSELYMWDGNYVDASKHLTHTLAGQGVINNNGGDTRWLLGDLFQGNSWITLWGQIIFNNEAISKEAISAVPYDETRNQTNNLQYWFSNQSPNVYYFKPAESLYQKYKNGKITNHVAGDYRLYATIDDAQEEKEIYKYTKGRKSYDHDAYIYIYRAAELWLMLAESLNQLGDIAAADSILNVGLVSSWDGKNSKLLAPFDAPTYTQNSNVLRSSLGVRGRAGQLPNYLSDFVEETAPMARKQLVLDSLIAEEVGLEHAYEGKKWFTLLRMARNSNHPEILANMISTKFPEGEREHYRQLLLNPENWFIKYDHLTVEE